VLERQAKLEKSAGQPCVFIPLLANEAVRISRQTKVGEGHMAKSLKPPGNYVALTSWRTQTTSTLNSPADVRRGNCRLDAQKQTTDFKRKIDGDISG
jgi:hypothetical protein